MSDGWSDEYDRRDRSLDESPEERRAERLEQLSELAPTTAYKTLGRVLQNILAERRNMIATMDDFKLLSDMIDVISDRLKREEEE